METSFCSQLANGYKSKSQIARVLTEAWTEQHMYCPVCGWPAICKFPNNRAVADFYCPSCNNQFEQKSKNGAFGDRISDGAYHTFIQRISGNDNPNFLVMNYSLENMRVEELYFIPKFFFVPEIVEQRKPLSENAKRAGWVGCNILLGEIPIQGRIPIVENGFFLDKSVVLHRVKEVQAVRTENITARSWLMDTLQCINKIATDDFTLEMMYVFENELSKKHPDNNNVRAKIRQQLQKLRDCGMIDFLGNGRYHKTIWENDMQRG